MINFGSRTNLHLLFVGQQARKTHVNIYQQSKQNYTYKLYLKKNIQFSITLSTSQNKERILISKVFCYIVIICQRRIQVCTPSTSKNTNCFRSGLTIGIGSLRDNSTHGKIMESLLGIVGVGSCTGISKWCTLGFSNQQAGI